MKIGVTGHQRIADASAWPWVRDSIRKQLETSEPLTGLSCLAIGADQLFAHCVLETGGRLVAVIPFPDYERTFQKSAEQEAYLTLKNQAAEVRVLPPLADDDQQSYLDAGKIVVNLCERLLAVWDGTPAQGTGGTEGIVQLALSAGRSVIQINPVDFKVQELKPTVANLY